MKIKFMQALLGLVLLAPMAAYAAGGDETSVDLLVLKMVDETTAEFNLADKPTISFVDGKFLVTSKSVTTDYKQADVTEFHFEKKNVTDGIGPVVNGLFSFVYNDNDHVTIFGSKAKKISVYTVDGKLLKSQTITDGKVTVNLDNLKAGIYVLNLEKEHTFKIIKK